MEMKSQSWISCCL